MKVKNVSGQAIPTSKGMVMPGQEVELSKEEANRLMKLKLVIPVDKVSGGKGK